MRRSGIAMVVAAALGLAACGSGGTSSPAAKSATTSPPVASRKVVLTSIVNTTAAKSARVELQVQVTGVPAGGSSGSGGSFDVTANGVTDFGSGESDLTMQFGGAIAASVVGDYEIRTVDGIAYVHVPSGSAIRLPAGKSWVATTLQDASGGGVGSPLDLGGDSDPTKVLAYLEKVSDDVKAVGPEQIRGVDTTHYTATLDMAKAIDETNKKLPAGMRAGMKALAGLFGSFPADVWIDRDGRLRRARIQIDFSEMFRGFLTSGSDPADHIVMTETLDLYDFGVPVHVEAPPADEVTTPPVGAGLGASG